MPKKFFGGRYIIPTVTKLPPRLKEVPLGGLAAPQTPLLPWGGEAPPDPRPGGKAPQTPRGRKRPRIPGEGIETCRT